LVRALLLTGVLVLFGAGCMPALPPLQWASPEGLAQQTPEVSPETPGTLTPGTLASPSANTVPVSRDSFSPSATAGTEAIPETPQDSWETPMPVTQPLTITIVFDNNAYDPRLKTSWGFSAMVAYHDHTLLFDTGGDGQILLENMRILGIDPVQIEGVVLSHAHGDHTGGLNALLEFGARPMVYLPPSFSASFKSQVSRMVGVSEVTPGLMIAEGLYTTGEMGQSIPEQALVIRTDQGLVIITGCAHPGIVAIVEQSQKLFDQPVRLVLGGFHLGSKSKAEIDSILKEFRRLGVEQVAPCHCTGETAIAMFAAEYGEDFIQAGAGQTIRLETAAIK
jgi:7,8-dihydropterin-6-yl-methyl-4-(beta-D-ribofuranosyl)aminobenzene 5'-phosphate synthase